VSAPTLDRTKKRHDHRRSIWGIAGGALLWCYQCGAWRVNDSRPSQWHRPTGIGGSNPAMRATIDRTKE